MVDLNLESALDFKPRDILIAPNTDVRYLPLMQSAAAIITDRGGILSHAAIIARELKIPCVVDTKEATKLIKTGDRIRVDAGAGAVYRVS